MIMTPIPVARRNQRGTLLELWVLAAMLAAGGAVLGALHPVFFALIPIGLLLPFAPDILEFAASGLGSADTRERLEELLKGGFSADVVVHAARSEGGASIAVDMNTGRVAFVSSSGTQVRDLVDVKSIELAPQSVSQWGRGTWTRYVVHFVFSETDVCGLSFPKLRKARNVFDELKQKLGTRIAFQDRMRLSS